MKSVKSTEIAETIDCARDYVQNSKHAPQDNFEALADDFATALVQVADACVIGLPCDKHGDAVLGQEAEELRKGLEQLLEVHGTLPEDVSISQEVYTNLRRDLLRLLDRVDARDSLAFLEAADAATAPAVAELRQAATLRAASDAQLLAIVLGESGSQASTELICRIAEELLLRRRLMSHAPVTLSEKPITGGGAQ